MNCLIVSHTHWDREWYRSFQDFRAHLVDAIDRLLDLLDADPGYRFLLDGQAITVEDYLEIRPAQRRRLMEACAAGRIALGPWYTQPDSLLPCGEAHVRNLLEGRRVAETITPRASRVAYVPDSFGHPAQFPQLFAGFGLGPFVYWRGDVDATAAFPPLWRWRAPDGSEVTAARLPGGYFTAGNIEGDVEGTAARLQRFAQSAPPVGETVLMMNGCDHLPPDATIGAVAERLATATGWNVRRGLLEDLARDLDASAAPVFSGELRGGVSANLLPGTYSSWMSVKLANRQAEAELLHWLEPFAALAWQRGLIDERPTLRHAWRRVIARQAHDSICGCSVDVVMHQVRRELEEMGELAQVTTARVLQRLAGQGTERVAPFTNEQEIAVFNPSPHPRTDVVRLPLDVHPAFGSHCEGFVAHPFVIAGLVRQGFAIDGRPARLVPSDNPDRMRILSEIPSYDVEFVATDVPALGWRRLRLTPCDLVEDVVDQGRDITNGHLKVSVADDGTLRLDDGSLSWSGLGRWIDEGDAGDSYDFGPCPDDPGARVVDVAVERRRHDSGVQTLTVTTRLELPAGLAADRLHRSDERVIVSTRLTARLVVGVPRLDLQVHVDNTARDHRLRLAFPTGQATDSFVAAAMFDVSTRSTAVGEAKGWKHRAPDTFPGQGWMSAGGLCVVAPGLPELSVSPEGEMRVTLLRAIGCISRADHPARPEPAGPGSLMPAGQCQGVLEARLSLLPGADARTAQDAEAGLRAVLAGPQPALEEGHSMLEVEPRELLLSTWKPAEDGDGLVVRLLNPTDTTIEAALRFGFPIDSVELLRLDETPLSAPIVPSDATRVAWSVGAHALCSLRVRPASALRDAG